MDMLTCLADFPMGESPGVRIGLYVLLELIGEGGMGTVWLAEQTHPVRRQVALKLIKPGMDSRQVLARFEAERQALALMDHPHIAKVLDAARQDPTSSWSWSRVCRSPNTVTSTD
jgi:eukaryotic-like serine/threonine-protein kinase